MPTGMRMMTFSTNFWTSTSRQIRERGRQKTKSSKGTKTDVIDLVFDADKKNENDDDSSISDDSLATKDLLERANERLVNQQLMDEIKELKECIERKDKEIEQMGGQLRMAVATKCDLIIAHTELERHHEVDLQMKEKTVKEMKSTNNTLVEMRADMEKEFMNELVALANNIEELQSKQKKEMHAKNEELQRTMYEVSEKEYQIQILEDQIRRLEAKNSSNYDETVNDKGFSARHDSTKKVRKYRKKPSLEQ